MIHHGLVREAPYLGGVRLRLRVDAVLVEQVAVMVQASPIMPPESVKLRVVTAWERLRERILRVKMEKARSGHAAYGSALLAAGVVTKTFQ